MRSHAKQLMLNFNMLEDISMLYHILVVVVAISIVLFRKNFIMENFFPWPYANHEKLEGKFSCGKLGGLGQFFGGLCSNFWGHEDNYSIMKTNQSRK